MPELHDLVPIWFSIFNSSVPTLLLPTSTPKLQMLSSLKIFNSPDILSHNQTPSVFPLPSQRISINEVSLVIKVSLISPAFLTQSANLTSATWLILASSRWLEIQLYLGSEPETVRVRKGWQEEEWEKICTFTYTSP